MIVSFWLRLERSNVGIVGINPKGNNFPARRDYRGAGVRPVCAVSRQRGREAEGKEKGTRAASLRWRYGANSAAAAAFAVAVAGLLALAEELLVAHDGLTGMGLFHVRNISVVFR